MNVEVCEHWGVRDKVLQTGDEVKADRDDMGHQFSKSIVL